MDNANLFIGNFHVPLLRPGFRKVVFSIVIMAIVLFYQKGIMGDREFSIAGIKKFFLSLPARFTKKKATSQPIIGQDAATHTAKEDK